MAKNYIYNFFSGNNKRDRGYSKDDAAKHTPFGFAHYFLAFWNNITKLTVANLLFLLTNIPLVCFAIAFPLFTSVNMPADSIYPIYYGVSQYGGSPLVSAFLTLNSAVRPTSVHNTTTIVLFCIGALAIFTFGPSCAGLTAVCRNAARGDCNFVWSTYFDAVKRNWKQAMLFGIIDVALVFLLIYDIIAYNANAAGSTLYLFLYVFSIFLAFVYFVMRFYIYLQMITFDLKLKQILKNSLYFVTLNFKRNVVGVLASALLLVIEYYMFASGVFVSVSLILPMIILISLLTYTSAFCAWPAVKKHVADAYYNDHPDEDPDRSVGDDDPVFTDRG